jgi:hypothetical protein
VDFFGGTGRGEKRVCVFEVIGVPSIFKLTRKVPTLGEGAVDFWFQGDREHRVTEVE